MAGECSLNRQRDWQFSQCSLMLNECLKQPLIEPTRASKLKKAVIHNNYEQVVEELKHGGKGKVNKLMTFNTAGLTLQLPPLCMAVFHRNLPVIHCLLKNGADPNRLGKVSIEGHSKSRMFRTSRVTPLLLALEDHPDEGFPFDPDVASALLDNGGDINTRAGSTVREEEEEGGSIEFNTHNTPLFNCVDQLFPRNKIVLEFLLDHGADMFARDADGRTPLQKGLMKLQVFTKPNCEVITIIEELIRRGGFCQRCGENTTLSEFALLLHAWKTECSDFHGASACILAYIHRLLDAGYQCSDKDVELFENEGLSSVDYDLGERVHGRFVYTLKHLCRVKIRECIGTRYLSKKVACLELPATLKDYLNLRV